MFMLYKIIYNDIYNNNIYNNKYVYIYQVHVLTWQ